jgi:hypothetical protein
MAYLSNHIPHWQILLYNISVIMMAKFSYFLLFLLLQSIIDTVAAAAAVAVTKDTDDGDIVVHPRRYFKSELLEDSDVESDYSLPLPISWRSRNTTW